MRSHFLLPALMGIVSAAPTPQDIDFDLAYSLPNPTYSEAVGVTAQSVAYDATTVYTAALEQITATAADDAAATDSPAVEKRTACATQPAGYGPVPSPDTASAFVSHAPFAASASAAPAPTGYTQMFTNLKGSSNAYGYLGYTTLKSYDVHTCAAKCNAISGCISINIHYERDPTVEPGNGCTNPASTTVIKCVFWGGPLTADSATNTGQYRSQFQVVIAGSNGYTNSSVATVPGYSVAAPLGNAAINAPYDKYGYNSYMGSAIFVGTFNAGLCGKACTEKSQYALANPPTDGSPVQTCQFFNTYILYINKDVQGQYCAMYSESWPSSYATNTGQTRGSDKFSIQYSFAYSNSTNPGAPNVNAAVYQARNDVLWPGNSALPYCSSVLGYTTPATTTTSTVTAYTTSTTTETSQVTVTATITGAQKRDTEEQLAPRATAIPKPDFLSKYPASIVTSACALAATPVTTTSTSTVLTTTIFTVVATVVTTATSTATVTVAAPSSGPSYTCDVHTCGTGAQGNYDINLICGQGMADVQAETTKRTDRLSQDACIQLCLDEVCDFFSYVGGVCFEYYGVSEYTVVFSNGYAYGTIGERC